MRPVARIGRGSPLLLLGAWCCGRPRPVCPAVGGGGGTIPRSRAQVCCISAGGRGHRTAGRLGDEGSGAGGGFCRWERVVESLRTLPCSWPGSRACCHRPWRWRLAWGGHRGRCASGRDEAAFSRLRGLAPGLDRVFTPTTRAAPPDPGHDMTVTRLRIWRLGVRIPRGAPPSPQLRGPVTGSLSVLRPPDCDQTATMLAATPNPTATTCDHDRRLRLHSC